MAHSTPNIGDIVRVLDCGYSGGKDHIGQCGTFQGMDGDDYLVKFDCGAECCARTVELIGPRAVENYAGRLRDGMIVWNGLTKNEMVVVMISSKPHVHHNVDGANPRRYELELVEDGWRLKIFPKEYITGVVLDPEGKINTKVNETMRFTNGSTIAFDAKQKIAVWDGPIGKFHYINNSPRKGVTQTFMATLKKATNLIQGLTQPLKNYMRLGWVAINSDEYVVTEDGSEALERHLFGLSGAEDLAEYAAKEVARLEKDMKKNNE